MSDKVNDQDGDTNETVAVENSSVQRQSDKYTATIHISGKPVEIKKLKAKEFFKAQEHFVRLFKALSDFQTPDKTVPTEGAEFDLSKLDPNNPDDLAKAAQVAEKMGNDSSIIDLLGTAPMLMAEFVAVCAGIDIDQYLENTYPEEISQSFAVCYKLNDVMANLKKLGAPMQMLG